VLCSPDSEATAAAALAEVPGVEEVLKDRVGAGPFESGEHLF
jgi:hypothetical protein